MNILRWFVCVATVATCGRSLVHAATPVPAAHPPYIEVAAEAEARATPNTALLEFGVVSRGEGAATAAQQNAERMQAVLAAVRASVGADATVGTGAYSLRTEYGPTRDGNEPRIVGYVASNIVRIETQETARTGEIVDVAIRAGANQVQRIVFGLADPASARHNALRAAVLRAQADAQTIAAALEVRLGPALSVTNQDAGPVRPYLQEAMVARSAPAGTPIEPGHVTVRARVVLRLKVDP